MRAENRFPLFLIPLSHPAGLTAGCACILASSCRVRRNIPTLDLAELTMSQWPVHARIDGPIVMIGFGSIGKGTLPLIERHFAYGPRRFVVIDPDDAGRELLDVRGIPFIHQAVTRDNYRDLLVPLLTKGGG